MTLVVRDPSKLDQLAATSERATRIELPQLTPSQNQALSERVSEALRACGCTEATVGLLGGAAAGALGAWLAALIWWQAALVVTGAALAASLTAKLAALRLARRRLLDTIRAIKRQCRAPGPAGSGG